MKNKEEVLRYWVQSKAKKKGRKTIKERLPCSAPALLLAELFLKEQAHSRSHKSRHKKKRESFSVSSIQREVVLLKQGKKKSFAHVLFRLCELAQLHRIDLEDMLRRKVLCEARKVSYGVQGTKER